MLQAMRSGAKSPLMKFFLIFLAGGFALWGIGDGSTGLIGGSDKAISAGEKSASPREVVIEFDRARRSFFPGSSKEEAIQGGLLNEVIGTMSRELLFFAETESLGITVTREMQRDTIANETSFQDEIGNFSEGRFIQALANAGYSEEDYLNRVTKILRREQLIDPILSGAQFDKTLAKIVATHELQKRSVKLNSFPFLPGNVGTPDDSTIEKFFKENKSKYNAPRLRSAKIGILSVDLIAKEIIINDEQVQNAFEERLNEYHKPETRTIQQMVFDDKSSAKIALKRLNSGENFSDVAESMLGWTKADTDLGALTKAALDANLADPIFDAKIGVISDPIKTDFGFHVLLINNITKGGIAKLEDVRAQIENTLRNEKAVDLLYDHVNTLEDSLGSGATIDEAISKVGGKIYAANDFDRRGLDINGHPISGEIGEILQDGIILDLIWESDLNTESMIQEGSDDNFFIVNVVGEKDERERLLSEVKSIVVSNYKNAESIKIARSAADLAAASLGADKDINASDFFRRNGLGLDHEAAGKIAKAAFNQKIGESQIVETDNEVIIVHTVGITEASREDLKETSELITSLMNNALREDMTNLMLLSLSQKHDLQLNLPSVQQLLMGSLK